MTSPTLYMVLRKARIALYSDRVYAPLLCDRVVRAKITRREMLTVADCGPLLHEQ
jgi:hypothetical protein